jgi:S1-C subfamily serine protease
MIQGLADFSAALAGLVAGAASLVVAIRTGQNRHITGVHWRSDTIVTTDQDLPARDGYDVIFATGVMVGARPGPRDPGANLALLRLESPVAPPRANAGSEPPVGSLILVVGAGFDAAPTATLGMVHGRVRSNGLDAGLALDLRGMDGNTGGAVLDANGRLLGIAAGLGEGRMRLLPHGLIARHAEPGGVVADGGTQPVDASGTHATAASSPAAARGGNRRGWLGVALQPITVPESLVARAGQTSGRMVVNITHGGPADEAGLRVGDVLLALNGYTTSGSHALRAFLGADRIGTQIEVRLLRDGSVLTTFLTVAAQPG